MARLITAIRAGRRSSKCCCRLRVLRHPWRLANIWPFPKGTSMLLSITLYAAKSLSSFIRSTHHSSWLAELFEPFSISRCTDITADKKTASVTKSLFCQPYAIDHGEGILETVEKDEENTDNSNNNDGDNKETETNTDADALDVMEGSAEATEKPDVANVQTEQQTEQTPEPTEEKLAEDCLVKLAKVNDVRVNTGQSGPVHAIIVTHAHSRDLECLVVKRGRRRERGRSSRGTRCRRVTQTPQDARPNKDEERPSVDAIKHPDRTT
ncbi:hypothetical protein LSAT2_001230 [Lamellibrachia satsuma]|nr:hypothetical protein LSAT2_001230 [Lamellibrachia satsuma]